MYYRQILFIILITAVGIYFLINTYEKTQSDSLAQLNKEELIHSRQVSNYLETTFKKYSSYLNYLSTRENIINLDNDGKELIKHFYNLHKNDIKAVTLVDSTGTIFYTYPDNKDVINKNISFRENIKKMIRDHTPSVSSVINTLRKFNGISIYYPLKNKNKFSGGIGIRIPFDQLITEALKDVKIKKTGYPWIIDQDGNILFHPDTKICNKNSFEIFHNSIPALSMLKNAVKGNYGNAEFSFQFHNDYKTESYYNVYYPIIVEDKFWSVIITIPKKEIFNMMHGILIKLLIIFVFLTLGILIYLYYIIKARAVLKEEHLRKKAEADLITSENRFKRFVEVSPDAIVLSDINGKIITCNRMAAKLGGYDTPEELIGLDTLDLISPENKTSAKENLLKTLNESVTTEIEYIVLRKDGTSYPAVISAAVITDKDDKPVGFAGIIRDITERKKIEKMLLDAKEAAEKSDRFKSEFLAQMSHEIRSPINAILSFANLLHDELYDIAPDDLKGSFSIMQKAGKRIIRTVDLILNMSELQTGLFEASFRSIKLKSEILDQVYLEFRQSARDKGIELCLINETGSKDINIVGDEYTLGQIFNNLVNNAIKFTEKGKVEIILLINKNNKVVVKIVDTGIGISDNYLQNLFKPFTQEEQGYTRRYEGNGLGLALVKKYCEINNAFIEVESIKDDGTRFSIIFKNDFNLDD